MESEDEHFNEIIRYHEVASDFWWNGWKTDGSVS